ncbi:MAG: RDD family protein [Candidatus Izimaplasma bacterium HR2]|nr:MAG: RDD family protein [Candidatus Izimaplasma bacterium HR2]
MKVSFFKRSLAYLLDVIPILFVLSILLSLFVGDILKNPYPDYDQELAIYQENVDDYYAILDGYYQDLTDEVITEDTYNSLSADLREDFTVINGDTETIIFSYYTAVSMYFLISFLVIKYFYVLLMKGQTLGLKMMQLQLAGRITWFSLLLREVFWREVYWLFTFSIGLWIDLAMIIFTNKKRTLRDIFSDTHIIHQGTSYPF